MPFYAVAKGRNPGIYLTWNECKNEINGFNGAVFKKFATENEAKLFIQERRACIVDKRDNICNNSENKAVSSENKAVSSKSFASFSISDDEVNGELSPTLLQMKKEMKFLQKQLSDLRSRFDTYVTSKKGSTNSSSKTWKRKATCYDPDPYSHTRIKLQKVECEEVDEIKLEKIECKGLTVNSEDFLIVYTDGACSSNGKSRAKAGIGVYFGENHPFNVSEPVTGRATNNTAEIQAAIRALEIAKSAGFQKVQVNTDSQFMINCITSWMPTWKKNNWIKRDGEEVINKDDLIRLDKASEGLLVKWNHVRGHSGELGNEGADRLARDGASRYQPGMTW